MFSFAGGTLVSIGILLVFLTLRHVSMAPRGLCAFPSLVQHWRGLVCRSADLPKVHFLVRLIRLCLRVLTRRIFGLSLTSYVTSIWSVALLDVPTHAYMIPGLILATGVYCICMSPNEIPSPLTG